ncbi:MAG: trypsin-like peptidase domain-containing protein [Chitinophagaceae bacterium]|nr:trypsin-like peptidase domain-containing protein [Chitinophagaceae bacterium]
MPNKVEQIEQIELYLSNQMSNNQKATFEKLLQSDASLREELEDYKMLSETFEHLKQKNFVDNHIEILRQQEAKNTQHINSQLSFYVNKYWRTASVAATVAIIASAFTFYTAQKLFLKSEQNRIIQLVNKDLKDIKRSQNAIKKEFEEVKTSVLPTSPSKFVGTSFAVSNNGYLVTNLHVVSGGSKIFIFTADNKPHACEIVSKDEENDIAILKVLEEDFKFAESGIPYRITKQNTGLAQNIFSLGFPKNEIVYNEGYISAINGQDGDSSKFQLEIPASPGFSGAPLFDAQGNVLGMINSKESQTIGTTFAIKADYIINTLKNIEAISSKDLNSLKFKSTSRTEQIKELQNYICIVKVYN